MSEQVHRLYSIRSPSKPELGVYYGLTGDSLDKEFKLHKIGARRISSNQPNYYTIVTHDMIMAGDATIAEIEATSDTRSKYDLMRRREELWRTVPDAIQMIPNRPSLAYLTGIVYYPEDTKITEYSLCACGSTIRDSSLKSHLQTKAHAIKLEEMMAKSPEERTAITAAYNQKQRDTNELHKDILPFTADQSETFDADHAFVEDMQELVRQNIDTLVPVVSGEGRSMRYQCECGSVLLYSRRHEHHRSQKHQAWVTYR